MKRFIKRLVGAGVGVSILLGGCVLSGPSGYISTVHAGDPTPTPTPDPYCSSPGCGGGGFTGGK